jgi:hypothetical protein
MKNKYLKYLYLDGTHWVGGPHICQEGWCIVMMVVIVLIPTHIIEGAVIYRRFRRDGWFL